MMPTTRTVAVVPEANAMSRARAWMFDGTPPIFVDASGISRAIQRSLAELHAGLAVIARSFHENWAVHGLLVQETRMAACP